MMRRRLFAAVIFAVPLAGALFACIDLDPIEVAVEAPEAGLLDVSALDASDGAPDVEKSPCTLCLEKDSGACISSLANCDNDPQCKQILDCAAAIGCLALPTVQAVVGCGIPCAQEAGLQSQFDPPGVEILALLLCAQKNCQTVCPWANDP